ncbi:MAG TPA: LysM peptidoglycan-binding domain-containing protein [Streptosporangiaceae bacterium]|nr:LysM peptidoglycan-binding domain-containing protein [Streptosporangiaceae bacterium]
MIATGGATPPLRLTRRGRMVVVGFLVFAGGLIWLAAAGGAAATGSGVSPSVYEKHMSQVVVRPGDTLWSIAVRAEPHADPRIVIERISDINALPSPEIAVGQRLWVPKD